MKYFCLTLPVKFILFLFLLQTGTIMAQEKTLIKKEKRTSTISVQLFQEEVPLNKEDILYFQKITEDNFSMEKILEETNWSENRYYYVTTKILTGMMQLNMPEKLEIKVEEASNIAPTKEELSLIEKYKDNIEDFF